MTHPAVYVITIGVAVGVALYAFFANRPQYDRVPNNSKSDFIDDSLDCTICISKISSDLAYLDCGHAFHRKCIRRWLNTNITCPNCKHIQRRNI